MKEYLGIIIGGYIPVLLFSIGGVLHKYSSRQSLSAEYFMFAMGIGFLVMSFFVWLFNQTKQINFHGFSAAFLCGLITAGGITLVTFALLKFNVPLSRIVPIHAMGTVLTTFLGLVIFQEWKEVQMNKLLIGVLLIVVGSLLVTFSKLPDTPAS